MANEVTTLTSLPDAQLLARVKLLAAEERHATATLIAGLMELDLRRLYLGAGCSSLFAYCTQVLHLSEDAAYNRIRAARVATRWPEVLELIANGALTVTAVRLLSDALTDTNHADLFAAATHKSKRDIESIVATANPRSDVPSSVRRVSASTTHASVRTDPAAQPLQSAGAATSSQREDERRSAGSATSSQREDQRRSAGSAMMSSSHEDECLRVARPPQASQLAARASHLAPLSAEHYRVQFTISKATHDKLRRVQDLMRHTNPNGDPAVIFDRALTMLLHHLEQVSLGKASRPRTQRKTQGKSTRRSRHIPSAVKRQVQARDRGRCAFVGAEGRCQETGFLQYHHVVAYADGGPTTAANIQLRCRAHNAYEAETWFGPLVVREPRGVYGFG